MVLNLSRGGKSFRYVSFEMFISSEVLSFVLILIFVLALTLLVSALSILLTVLTLAVLAILVALITSPQETKRFFSQTGHYIDSWVQAMVKLVKESGELVKSVLQQTKARSESNSDSEGR